MTEAELNRHVARATGESLAVIRRRGFSIADAMDVEHDPEPHDPLARYLDWDAVQRTRHVALVG